VVGSGTGAVIVGSSLAVYVANRSEMAGGTNRFGGNHV
jgi:hypothetical protein